MENKHLVHNLVILDESGSMQSIKDFIINGFNELVQSIRGAQEQFPDQEHRITVVSFNSNGNKTLLDNALVNQLQPINGTLYRPDAMTPLYDAMGTSIGKLRGLLEGAGKHNVLVTILTDGAENASKEYDGPAIKKLVEEMKAAGWTFTYIGTDHNVERSAQNISIQNVMVFHKSQQGVSAMFSEERHARRRYMDKLAKEEDVREDYYKKEDKPKS